MRDATYVLVQQFVYKGKVVPHITHQLWRIFVQPVREQRASIHRPTAAELTVVHAHVG